jgi:hypothetical protein
VEKARPVRRGNRPGLTAYGDVEVEVRNRLPAGELPAARLFVGGPASSYAGLRPWGNAMDEEQWFAKDYPEFLLGDLRDSEMLSERKARLFGVACSRRIWHLLTDERSRRAVEVAERFTEGAATAEELREALDPAWQAYHDSEQARDASLRQGRPETVDAAYRNAQAARAVAFLLSGFFRFVSDSAPHAMAAAAARLVLVEERHRVPRRKGPGRVKSVLPPVSETVFAARCAVGGREVFKLFDMAEPAAQQALLRDLCGPLPFRPVTIEPAWLAWNAGTVRRLAEAAYHERSLPEGTLSNGRLAVLADALEEAGCADADLLGHLRGPGPRVLGCWCVDLLLGKG